MNKAQAVFLAALLILTMIWLVWSWNFLLSNPSQVDVSQLLLAMSGAIVGFAVLIVCFLFALVALWDFLGKEGSA